MKRVIRVPVDLSPDGTGILNLPLKAPASRATMRLKHRTSYSFSIQLTKVFCRDASLTGRQRHLELAAEDAGVKSHNALREQDLLLALQADRHEGPHEVVVVDVRRDAVACESRSTL